MQTAEKVREGSDLREAASRAFQASPSSSKTWPFCSCRTGRSGARVRAASHFPSASLNFPAYHHSQMCLCLCIRKQEEAKRKEQKKQKNLYLGKLIALITEGLGEQRMRKSSRTRGWIGGRNFSFLLGIMGLGRLIWSFCFVVIGCGAVEGKKKIGGEAGALGAARLLPCQFHHLCFEYPLEFASSVCRLGGGGGVGTPATGTTPAADCDFRRWGGSAWMRKS